MFSLRIHSVDPPPLPSPASELPSSSSSQTTLRTIKGIVHLFRSPSPPSSSYLSAASSSSSAPTPPSNSLLIFVVAVPRVLSHEDFTWVCDSFIQRALSITFLNNDQFHDRYSVLLQFDDHTTADRFYAELNGWKFPSSDVGEVCHVLYLSSAEFTDSVEIAGTPPVGSTELPTCPVCIERLDQDISGIVVTSCDHSFQCPCVSKWVNSSCPVCQLCQNISSKQPTCSICLTNENLWICVICGFVGCGRYKSGHAFRHWKERAHCYSLDLETHRVWDYVGDNYVHRLNHSKSDESNKYDKSKFGKKGGEVSGVSGGSADQENDDEFRALHESKVHVIVDEYNVLLASQLETQRHYYEGLLLEAKNQRSKKENISKAVDECLNLKLREIQQKFENLNKENKNLAIMNDELAKNQNIWREKLNEIEQREKETSKSKDETIRDLEEQIRDFTVCIEAQKTIGKVTGGDKLRGGMLLPVPDPPPTKSKKLLRSNKKEKLNDYK